MVYTLRIELDHLHPKVWRTFQIHPEVTFHQLHQIIQSVMGWDNCHLYEFLVNDQSFGLPNPEFYNFGARDVWNARRETVQNYINRQHARFTYHYDFGDGWQHTVELIDSNPAAEIKVPVCLDGARHCPPEDAGGVPGYEHMLKVLLDPDHLEHEDISEWVGEEFDPEYFSAEEVNRTLLEQKKKFIPKSMKQLEGGKPVKLTKASLRKHLKQLSSEQLMDLVSACYSASKEMEIFLAARILGEEAVESLCREYSKKIEKEFFPERGFGKARLPAAENAITEFEKLTGNIRYSLELKIIYVEMLVSYTLTYGDIGERFYNRLVSMFAEIIDTINEDDSADLFDEFEERIEDVVSKSSHIGWGVDSDMADLRAQLDWY